MPKYIYVETRATESPLTRELLQSYPDCKIFEIQDHRKIDSEPVPVKGYSAKIKNQVRVLAYHPGPWIRPFPGSSEKAVSPEFFVAHANGCPFDCRYCFLQGYFDHGAPVVFVNQDHLFREMAEHLEQHAHHPQVTYHAGELSDALAMEAWSGFAARAIECFRDYPSARLELRTKCAGVEAFLPVDPPDNAILSWTLTPGDVWRHLEPGTPSPTQRLKSMSACRAKGYQVGARLDPAILFPQWEPGYAGLIREIFEYLPPGAVESFVLGGFRYTASLGVKIRERFPESGLLTAEFVLCPDGKHRYFRPLRVHLYRKIIREILKYDEKVEIQLCMETKQVEHDVWQAFQGTMVA